MWTRANLTVYIKENTFFSFQRSKTQYGWSFLYRRNKGYMTPWNSEYRTDLSFAISLSTIIIFLMLFRYPFRLFVFDFLSEYRSEMVLMQLLFVVSNLENKLFRIVGLILFQNMFCAKAVNYVSCTNTAQNNIREQHTKIGKISHR